MPKTTKSISFLDSLLVQNYDLENSTVNMKRIKRELKNRGYNITDTFLVFFENTRNHDYSRKIILDELLSMLEEGRLTKHQAERLLVLTVRYPVSIYGDGEEFTCIYALDQTKYIEVLLNFFPSLFVKREKWHRDWRWLVFSVISVLLANNVKSEVLTKYKEQIKNEAYQETDELRRSQMIEIANKVLLKC